MRRASTIPKSEQVTVTAHVHCQPPTRLATTAQRTALALRDGGCVIPGCGRPPSECQTHHVTDWAHGGRTDLDSLASLCWVHHRQVDLHKWRLTRNTDPHGPHWTVTPIRRHAWRKRRPA